MTDDSEPETTIMEDETTVMDYELSDDNITHIIVSKGDGGRWKYQAVDYNTKKVWDVKKKEIDHIKMHSFAAGRQLYAFRFGQTKFSMFQHKTGNFKLVKCKVDGEEYPGVLVKLGAGARDKVSAGETTVAVAAASESSERDAQCVAKSFAYLGHAIELGDDFLFDALPEAVMLKLPRVKLEMPVKWGFIYGEAPKLSAMPDAIDLICKHATDSDLFILRVHIGGDVNTSLHCVAIKGRMLKDPTFAKALPLQLDSFKMLGIEKIMEGYRLVNKGKRARA